MQDYYKAVAASVEEWSLGAAPQSSRGSDFRSQPDFIDNRNSYDQYGNLLCAGCYESVLPIACLRLHHLD